MWPQYEGRSTLIFSGPASQVDSELTLYCADPSHEASFEKVPGQPAQIFLRARASPAKDMVSYLNGAAQTFMEKSRGRKKAELQKEAAGYETYKVDLSAQFNQLVDERARRCLRARGTTRPRRNWWPKLRSSKRAAVN